MALELLSEEKILLETRMDRAAVLAISAFFTLVVYSIVLLVHTHKDAFMVYEIRAVAYLLSLLDPRAAALNNIDVDSTYYKFCYVISLAMIFVTLIRLMVPVVQSIIRLNSRYILTNQRVLLVEGLVFRTIIAVPLERIESVTLRGLPMISTSLLLKGYGKLRLKLRWPRQGAAFQSTLCHLLVRPAEVSASSEKI